VALNDEELSTFRDELKALDYEIKDIVVLNSDLKKGVS
jgi:hypothetical protein